MPSPFFNSPYGHVKPQLMHALSFKRKKSHVASVAAATVLKAFTNPRVIRQSVKYRNMFHTGQGLVRERRPGEKVTPEKGWLTDEEDESEGGKDVAPVDIDLTNVQEYEVEKELMKEPEVLVVAVQEPAPLDHIHDEEDLVKNDLLKLEISLSESTNLEVKKFTGSLVEHRGDARVITAGTPAPLIISTVDTSDIAPENDPVVEDTNTILEQVEEPSPEIRGINEVIQIAEIPIEAEEAVPLSHTAPLVQQPQPEQSTTTTTTHIQESTPMELWRDCLEPIQSLLPESAILSAPLQPLLSEETLGFPPQVVVIGHVELEAIPEIEHTQDAIPYQELEIESKQVVETASKLQDIGVVLSEEVLEVKPIERVEEPLFIEIAEPLLEALQNEIHASESTPNPTPDVNQESEMSRKFDMATPLGMEDASPQPSKAALVAFSEKHSEQLFDDKESSCTEAELNEDEDSEDTDETINQEFEGIFFITLAPWPRYSDKSNSILGRLESTPSHVFKLILPIPPSVNSHASSTIALTIHPEHTLKDLQKQIELGIPHFCPCHITFTTSDIEPTEVLSKSGPTDYVLKPSHDGDSLCVTKSVSTATCWSLSTEMHSFIGDASKTRCFNINISTSPTETPSTIIRILLPIFSNRTVYLRSELRSLVADLVTLTNLKLECDAVAYRSVQKRSMLALVTSLFVSLTLPLLLSTIGRFSQPTILRSPPQWDSRNLHSVIAYLILAFGNMILLACFTYIWSAYHSVTQSHGPDLATVRNVYLERGFDLVKWETLQKEEERIRSEIRKLAAEYRVTGDGIEETGGDSLAATAA